MIKKKGKISKGVKKKPVGFKSAKEKEKLSANQGESEMVVVGEITKPSKPPKEYDVKGGEKMAERRWDLFITYVLTWLTGIIFYIIGKDKTVKRHAIQAILLGIVAIILGAVTFGVGSVLVWLYCLYVGWMASGGKEVEVPYITNFAKEHV